MVRDARVLSDEAAIAMALGSFGAAIVGWSIAVWIPVVVIVVALVWRRPWVLVLRSLPLRARWVHAANAPIRSPNHEREVREWVTVVRDPSQTARPYDSTCVSVACDSRSMRTVHRPDN